MERYTKHISLILVMVLLFNFVMSSFSCSFAASVAATVTAKSGKSEYRLSTETGLNKNQYNIIEVKADADGVYEISVKNQGVNAPYDITDSGNNVLPLVSYGGSPLYSAAGGSTVKVAMKKGETYRIHVYSDAKEGSNYVININQAHAGLTDVKAWDVPSSDYTSSGKNDGSVNKDTISTSTLSPLHKHEDENERAPSKSALNEDGGNVDFVQKVITWLFVFGIADQLRAIIMLMFGDVTIDSLLFNHYNDTKLAFYPENGRGNAEGNRLLETPTLETGILAFVGEYYAAFRGIAIAFYLIMLLYIGLRIIMKSTARDKDKFKSMLMDWFMGILILFFFPYVIKYLILLNESLVRVLETRVIGTNDVSGGISSPSGTVEPQLQIAMGKKEEQGGEGLMLSFRTKAVNSGNLGFGFVYIYLLIKLFGFLLFFFKRMITILFLIVLFPFVAISYSLDKVKDGKAQIFTSWFKELLLNIFTQFFQAVIWIVVMFVVNALISGSSNVVVVCIGVGFVSKGDMLLRALFPNLLGGGGANTASPIAQTAQTAVAMDMFNRVSDRTKQVSKRFNTAKETIENTHNERLAIKDAKLEETLFNQEKRLADQTLATVSDPVAMQTAITEASIRRNDGVSSNERRDIAERQREENEDKKFAAMQNIAIGLSLEQTAASTQQQLDEKLATMKPEQREKFMAELGVVRATQELITGKAANGRTLTRLELGLSASIVIEAMEAKKTDPKYKDVKRWLERRQVVVDKKIPVNPSIKSAKDAKAWEAKHKGMSAFRTEQQTIGMREYLGFADPRTSTGSISPNVGLGIKGKVLTTDQQKQMSAADRLLGGRSGVHTGKTVEGTSDAITGAKAITSRVKEGEDVGAASVYTMTADQREASHRTTVKDYAGHDVSAVDKLVEDFDQEATGAEKEDLRSAAELIMELGSYSDAVNMPGSGQQAGVSAAETLRITNQLVGLSRSNAKVARMVQSTLSSTAQTKGKSAVGTEGGKVKVNIGVSLEGLRAMSAKTVLTDKKMDAGTRRTSTQDAIEVLQEVSDGIAAGDETLDDIAAATYERSELDAYIGENATEDDAFSLTDGLVRSEATNEQIMAEQFMEQVKQKAKRDAEQKLAQAKKERPGRYYKAARAVVDATVGNAVRASTVLVADSLYVGLDKTPSPTEALATTAAAAATGDALAHPLETIGNIAGVHPIEEAMEERAHRRKIEPAKHAMTDAEREAAVKKSEAARNITAFKNKLL